MLPFRTMRRFAASAFASAVCSFLAASCGDSASPPGDAASADPIPVDYTEGRAMNARLGQGIVFTGFLDPKDGAAAVRDQDFAIVKSAGFNSVRIPVSWEETSDTATHMVDPDLLDAVLRDVRLAVAKGLAVVVAFRAGDGLVEASGGATARFDSAAFEKESARFLGLWAQLASTMAEFRDDMVALELLDGADIPDKERGNQLLADAYAVVRAAAPEKTIVFPAPRNGSFADLGEMDLPADGNIVVGGRYYEPADFTHQGAGFDCRGDAALINGAAADLRAYAALAAKHYPDVSGVGHVPLNLGSFGVAGSTGPCGADGPSDRGRAYWTMQTAKAAVGNGFSFHYRAFSGSDGFEIYDVAAGAWHPGFPQALVW